MAYDWEAFRGTCYNLYIDEQRSLEEIMVHMRVHYGFSPSRRAFQSHFRQWKFPSKQATAHENAGLVRRVRELWERNLSQGEMLNILHAEGYDVRLRQLMRLRARHQLLLREPGGRRAAAQRQPEDGGEDEEEEAEASGQGRGQGPVQDEADEVEAEQHLQLRQVESTERLESRKRRRRTRSYAGLPADPPGPPRFPSEMPVSHSRLVLGLTAPTADAARLYNQIRARFQAICAEQGIVRKTQANPAIWEAVKDRLVRETPHLQAVMVQGGREDVGSSGSGSGLRLALDVLCTDICKRVRLVDQRMTLAVARNTLGLNPREARDIRSSLYEVLRDDGFTSKQQVGPEHWQTLQQRWLDRCAQLRQMLEGGGGGGSSGGDGAMISDDLEHARMLKAVGALARDVVKRWQDDQRRPRRPPRRESREEEPRALGRSREARELGADMSRSPTADSGILVAPTAGDTADDDLVASSLSDSIEDDDEEDSEGSDGDGDGNEQQLDEHGSLAEIDAVASGYASLNQTSISALVGQTAHLHSSPPPLLLSPSLMPSMTAAGGGMAIDPRLGGGGSGDGSHLVVGHQLPLLLSPADAMMAGAAVAFGAQHGFVLTPPPPPPPLPLPPPPPPLPLYTRFAPYFRLHPLSTYPTPSRLWIGLPIGNDPSVAELRAVAVGGLPPDAMCGFIQGILRGEDGESAGSAGKPGRRRGRPGSSIRPEQGLAGGDDVNNNDNDDDDDDDNDNDEDEEVRVQIATDEQLQAFLSSLGPEESPMFVVQLLSSWTGM